MTRPDVDHLEQILSSEEPIVPSSGFVSGVMQAVHDAAIAPAPLPFPWRRFLGGLAACFAAAAAGSLMLRDLETAIVAARPPGVELGYAALAVAASILPLYVRRIARR